MRRTCNFWPIAKAATSKGEIVVRTEVMTHKERQPFEQKMRDPQKRPSHQSTAAHGINALLNSIEVIALKPSAWCGRLHWQKRSLLSDTSNLDQDTHHGQPRATQEWHLLGTLPVPSAFPDTSHSTPCHVLAFLVFLSGCKRSVSERPSPLVLHRHSPHSHFPHSARNPGSPKPEVQRDTLDTRLRRRFRMLGSRPGLFALQVVNACDVRTCADTMKRLRANGTQVSSECVVCNAFPTHS